MRFSRHQRRSGEWFTPVALRLLLVVCLAGAACRDTTPPGPPADGVVRLVFKHMRMFGDPAVLDSVLRDFESAHPNVRVVSETLPNDTDLQHQFFITNLEGGSRDFDVMNLDIVWVPEFARAGWLLDLSSRMPPSVVHALFLPGPAEVVTWSGRTWALPWFADAGLLYWREDLLSKHGFEPPVTWEGLASIAHAVLEKEGDPSLRGFVWQGRQYEGLVCAALEVVRGFGGGVLGADGGVILESPDTIAGVAFLRGLVTSDASPGQVLSSDEETARHQFQQGRAVFMRNWPYAWSLLQSEGSPVRGKVGMGPVPSMPGHAGGGTLGGWQLAINGNTPEWKRDAAFALVRHLTSPEVQRTLLRAYAFKPTLKSLYQDEALLSEEPLLRELYPVLAGARPRPVTPYYLMMSQVLQSEFSAAVTGIRTPEESMTRAAQQVRHILGRSSEEEAPNR